jgi:hypothetical protein
MKPAVIYIHGFASGPGLKATQFRTSFPGSEIIAPQLTGMVNEDLAALEKLIVELHNDAIHVVGTSLGGFYTLCLASKLRDARKSFKFYVINPAFSPDETLFKYKDQEVVNYKSTGPSITLTDADFTALKDNKVFIMENFAAPIDLYIFIALQDVHLNFNEFLEFIARVPHLEPNIHYSNQDHRYSNIDSVINQLRLNNVN